MRYTCLILSVVSFMWCSMYVEAQEDKFLTDEEIIEQKLVEPWSPDAVGKTQLQKLMDSTISRTVAWRFMQLTLPGTGQHVTNIRKNNDYELWTYLWNNGTELSINPLRVRVVGNPGEIKFYRSCRRQNLTNSSRTHISFTDFFPGQFKYLSVCFRAMKNMSVEEFSVKLGLYGKIDPIGSKWITMHPRVSE